MAHIAVLSQQVRHWTGGRLYCYQIACALCELGHEVHLYVDRDSIPFRRDFDLYRQPQILQKSLGNLGDIPDYDLFIGLPMLGATAACMLGQRYSVPSVVCILDVLPLMRKYRDDRSPALSDWFWEEMLSQIRFANSFLFVLADYNKKPTAEWTGIPEKRIFTVYPAVNDRVIDGVGGERGYQACFVSRLEPHKRFSHAVDAVKPLGLHLHVVTAQAEPGLVDGRDMSDYVTFHRRVSDKVKFQVISNSLFLISASIWEGFGMFIIEALACSTPVVCYSFPTFHEIVDGSEYERYVYFAKYGDRGDLMGQAMRCMRDGYAGVFEPDTRFGMNRMMMKLGGILEEIL